MKTILFMSADGTRQGAISTGHDEPYRLRELVASGLKDRPHFGKPGDRIIIDEPFVFHDKADAIVQLIPGDTFTARDGLGHTYEYQYLERRYGPFMRKDREFVLYNRTYDDGTLTEVESGWFENRKIKKLEG